jgi:PAS domain S-box-containing protein
LEHPKHEMAEHAYILPRNDGRRYEAVLRLGEALSACPEPEDLTKVLSEQLREFLDFIQFYIIVYKKKSSEVEWAVLGREKSLIAAYADVPLEQRPSWQAYSTQEPLHIQDWSTDRRVPARLKQGIAAQGLAVGPLVFVPLTTPHRRLGALGMFGAPGTIYSTDDVSFLRLIGRVVAFAIDDNFNLRQAEVTQQELQRQNERLQRSERELREVIETIPAMAWSAAADGAAEFFNGRWLAYAGLTADQAQGWGWTVAIHPDDLKPLVDHWRAVMASGQSGEIEARWRRFDGVYRWFLFRTTPSLDDNGRVVKWYGTNTDIEERKRAESLLAGEKRILEMVAKGDSLSGTLDALCRLVEEQACGVLASILLLDGIRLRHGAAPSLPKAYTDAIDGGVIGPSEGSCGTAAYRGQQVIVEDIATDPLWAAYRDLALPHSLRACWSTPIFSSQDKVLATFAMYYREPRRPIKRDQEIIEQITHLAGVAIERKQTQEILQRSKAYLAEAQRLTLTGSCAIGGTSRETVYWSEEMYRLFDFDPQQGLPVFDQWLQRIHPEDRDKVKLASERTFLKRVDCDVEFRLVKLDGTIRHIHGIGHPVVSSSGELIQVVGTMVDVTERRRTEESLRRSESYLAQAQRLAHIGSWAWEFPKRNALYISEEWYRIYGFDPNDGMPSWEQRLQRVHPEDRTRFKAAVDRAIAEKSDYDLEFRILPPDAPARYIHSVGHPILDPSGESAQFVGVSMDITESKQAEQERERLRQAQADLAHINRINMMGELAASLAHEIKQPIAAAITSATACLRWLAHDPPDLERARGAAMRIEQDGNRAADVINRLRSFYKKGTPPEREMIDVNEIVRGMMVLLRNEAVRHSVTIHPELAAYVPKILADRVQLQQVFMNLMLNAIEAMKDTGGKLTITSQFDQEGQLAISVSDTGVGLPAEGAERIFDAFYTTKPQGTGMGLAITRSIVESHGGNLWATGNEKAGTTFHFTLRNEAEAHA